MLLVARTRTHSWGGLCWRTGVQGLGWGLRFHSSCPQGLCRDLRAGGAHSQDPEEPPLALGWAGLGCVCLDLRTGLLSGLPESYTCRDEPP